MGDAPATHHLDPKAPMHPLVLVPGDPARAMAIATDQLVEPRMFNHRRGLWGYSGHTPQGIGIVVQSTGMGGPSAAIVCEELVALGATTLIRAGTCGAISPALKIGEILVAESVIAADGTSQALGADPNNPILPDPQLTRAIYGQASTSDRATHLSPIASVDLFYDPAASARYADLQSAGAAAIEMEAATVLAVAARHNVCAACILGVTDELTTGNRKRLSSDEIERLGLGLGEIAITAFAMTANAQS